MTKKMRSTKTTESRDTYKPIQFEWALKACESQHQMHWMPYEINLMNDINEFHQELTEVERNIIIQILRLFTQMDVEVGRCYVDYYLRIFTCPEIRMMLITFASIEVIHVLGYAYLITSLHLPDSEYSAFLQYKEMLDKYDVMHSFDISNPTQIAITLALVSGFIEGLVLFASFAILMYFSLLRGEHSKSCLHGIGQIVTFSIRDETLHCLSVIQLFHTYIEENKDQIDMKKLRSEIYKHAEIIINNEIAFVELVFKEGSLDHLSKEDVILYIKYLADIRFTQLGFEPMFGIKNNPLEWMDTVLYPKELSNFFEVTASSYTKGSFENVPDGNFWDQFNNNKDNNQK